jgi:integrase
MERDVEMQNHRNVTNDRRQATHERLLPPLIHFGDHLTPVLLLSMNTGRRRGEIPRLRWACLDFTCRLLAVEGRNAKIRQTRHVPLNEEAVSVLRRWREQSGTGSRVFNLTTGFRTAWENLLKRASQDHPFPLARSAPSLCLAPGSARRFAEHCA